MQGGVGFSKASKEWTGEESDKRTEDDVATSFYAFLQNFYTVFGKELAEKKLYLTGQSYAGMYIPSIAREIHHQNKRISWKDKRYGINLHGLAIGNGWIDAKIQASTYVDYAWWHGMIDLQDYRGLKAKWEECIQGKILDSPEFHTFTTSDECGIIAAVMKASGNEFMYDVTSYDAYPAIFDKGMMKQFFYSCQMTRRPAHPILYVAHYIINSRRNSILIL
jgi:carboxypeptidase C (cathepsin A)